MDAWRKVDYKLQPMSTNFSTVEITDSEGRIREESRLKDAEIVNFQLRPLLPFDYVRKMKKIFSEGGRMAIAMRNSDVVAVAVYRIYENKADGSMMYVDDLVTDQSRRSMGAGKALLDHLTALARDKGCDHLKLDSGTQRQQAHKFYFREGLTIVAFHFLRALKKWGALTCLSTIKSAAHTIPRAQQTRQSLEKF